MGIGVGLILVAVGAVLAFAVNVSNSHGFDINTIGWILMIVGVVGVLLDLLIFMPRRRTSVVRTAVPARPAAYVDDGNASVRTTRVDEEI